MQRARVRMGGYRCGIAALSVFLFSSSAFAKADLTTVPPHNVIIGVLFVGLVLLAAFCVIFISYERKRAVKTEFSAQRDVHAMAQRLALSEMLSRFDEQAVLFWEKPGAQPVDLMADTPSRLKSAPCDVAKLLRFSEWLESSSASELGHRMKTFQDSGTGFTLAAQTKANATLEIEARVLPAGPMLRLRPLSDQRAQSVQLADKLTKAVRELETLRALLNEIPVPIWLRLNSGQLSWVNKAYASIVDAADPQQAVKQGYELLDQATRQKAVEALGEHGSWQSPMLAIANGRRRNLQIILRASGVIEAGCAVENADSDFTNREVERVSQAHQRTLDHLATAVAIFGADRKLVYYNPAWQKLWELDPVYLEEKPDEGAILDRLREQRKLPEQADYKNWKAQHLESYSSNEPREEWWHSPDGRTLRVFTHPNPQGGITLVQENVTEVLDLKSRAAAYERMQHETLDALSDAVAVFGSDGRLRLTNPALLNLWKLDKDFVSANPHIDDIIAKGMTHYANPVVWGELKQSVIAFGEERRSLVRQLELKNGAVIDVASVPLPDGATLMTFVDVTAAVNVERALKDRNDALEAATRLKNDFIQHMSYELRSPLTNIIGFTQLLIDPHVGPLNPRQHEYMGYISSSSSALLALINDILDLATIDAGAMELDLAQVDIREAMDNAVEALHDKLSEKSVRVEVKAAKNIGVFTADARRVRQVLYNVLSNAVGVSEPGQKVELAAERNKDNEVVFTVTDHGPGIAEEDMPHIFERFEGRIKNGTHRGVGLGLSIVKSFLELHGGRIEIASKPGAGTTASLVFPVSLRKLKAKSAA